MKTKFQKEIDNICENTVSYLMDAQDFKPGEYFGSFWSEKAYHGPLLDWHAGGAHHHRGTGSAALAFQLLGLKRNDAELKNRAGYAFDWIASRQHERGGYAEIQNNDKPSDWEHTGLDELSTIETAFAIRGLADALRSGLPPKKSYMDCLKRAGHWQLSIEFPAGSGIFPHHERSPYNTLNAATHAAETLASIYVTLEKVYGVRINIFLHGAFRAIKNVISCQWENGCFPYRENNGSTINYTSLAVWCILNVMEIIPDEYFDHATGFPPGSEIRKSLNKAADFLRGTVGKDGSLLWEDNEESTAKYNMWTYIISANVLLRIGGKDNADTAGKILDFALRLKTDDGLLPMRDRGEKITRCAFMQADMLLFLLPFSSYIYGKEDL